MATLNPNKQNQNTAAIVGGASALEMDFYAFEGGKFPTVFQIYNFGTAPVSVSDAPNVSASNNLFQIAAGGVAVFANPKGYSKLYFISSANAPITVNSWYAPDVSPMDLYQTMATVIINSTTTSNVTLSAPIPAGTNQIGHVIVDSGGGGAVTEADGANVTLGAKGDTAAANGGVSASVNAVLKGILTSCQAATPAGTNEIGFVKSADGDLVTIGNTTDAAVAVSGGTGSVIAQLRAILSQLNSHTLAVTSSDMSSAVPTIYNITMTTTGIEYSQAITNARKIVWRIRNGVAGNNTYFAYTTGKVAPPTAPYETIPQNTTILMDDINISSATLYFATTLAGAVIELEIW